MTAPQNIAVLGATGSIGQNTLDVIRHHPERFRVFALSGHSNIHQLARDAQEFSPQFVVLTDVDKVAALRDLMKERASGTEILAGAAALEALVQMPEVDVVMAAIVGAAGLSSSLAAARSGKRLLLANKESLVVAGALMMSAVRDHGAELLPIDSEHNAIWQCLPADRSKSGVASVLLTASGGPFRELTQTQMSEVSPEQAVAHPNWSMGRKISVDSATLMNKGLELIEACWLFDVTPQNIEVVVHPQSVIHSMVRYVDGSVIAQMGSPDMRTPIAYGLAYPDRIHSGATKLDFNELLTLNFSKPDRHRFPCLALAEQAIEAGGIMPAVLNAVNEVSVDAFLNRRIKFTEIAEINAEVMQYHSPEVVESIEQLLEVDAQARHNALQRIGQRS